MKEERKTHDPGTAGQSAETALDTVNAELRRKRDMPKALRRRIEAGIEEKSRKRRSNEVPVSSTFKDG